jgi:hypothetical protein
LRKNIRKPRSNRYSKNYKPDLDYILDHLDNTISFSDYIADNLDTEYQKYSDYLVENLDKTNDYSKYVAESLESAFNRRYNFTTSSEHIRCFKIISKGRDYIILDGSGSVSSHWISKDDKLIDKDGLVHTILNWHLTPSGLYLLLDGHLKLNAGEDLYVK